MRPSHYSVLGEQHPKVTEESSEGQWLRRRRAHGGWKLIAQLLTATAKEGQETTTHGLVQRLTVLTHRARLCVQLDAVVFVGRFAATSLSRFFACLLLIDRSKTDNSEILSVHCGCASYAGGEHYSPNKRSHRRRMTLVRGLDPDRILCGGGAAAEHGLLGEGASPPAGR